MGNELPKVAPIYSATSAPDHATMQCQCWSCVCLVLFTFCGPNMKTCTKLRAPLSGLPISALCEKAWHARRPHIEPWNPILQWLPALHALAPRYQCKMPWDSSTRSAIHATTNVALLHMVVRETCLFPRTAYRFTEISHNGTAYFAW